MLSVSRVVGARNERRALRMSKLYITKMRPPIMVKMNTLENIEGSAVLDLKRCPIESERYIPQIIRTTILMRTIAVIMLRKIPYSLSKNSEKKSGSFPL